MSETLAVRRRGSKKAALFTESVIREMTRLSMRYGGVNLAQGFPDFPAPAEIKEAAVEAIRRDINQYAITWGAKSLRNALAERYRELYGMDVDPGTPLDGGLRLYGSHDRHDAGGRGPR